MPRTWCVFAVACLVGSGCTYGPPERFVSLEDYDTPPGTEVTIALRSFSVSRPPTGLNAFPDGGFAKDIDGGVEVNVCYRTTGDFRQVAVLHEPWEHVQDLGSPRILDWRDTAIRFTRYSGGDTVARLPRGLHVGLAPRNPLKHFVLPECEASLGALKASHRMPDGTTDSR
jgi:hypothetical protein